MMTYQLRSRNLLIQRNARYTGDGGVCGISTVAGQPWLTRVKRYTGMVKAADIMDFVLAYESEAASGLFVHTGRTPPAARGRPLHRRGRAWAELLGWRVGRSPQDPERRLP